MSEDHVRASGTDFFDERLKEINSEMQGILDRTKKTRSELHAIPASEAATAAVPPSTSEAAYCPMSANDYEFSPLVRPSYGSCEKWERAISRMCQMEVAKWMDSNLKLFLEPLIQTHVGQQVEVIQRGLQDLRFSHREVLAAVGEVRCDVADQRNNLTSLVQRLERQTNHVKQQLHDEIDHRTKDVKEALSSVEETVDTLRHLMQTEHQRGARRLEEAVRRQQEQARWTLSQIEAQVYEWRDEVSARLRQHVDQLRDQHSSLEHHVCRLQGIVDSTVEATNRQAADVRVLLEDGVAQRSELRGCHRDLNRLEMTLQLLTGGGGGKSMATTTASRDHHLSSSGAGGHPTAGCFDRMPAARSSGVDGAQSSSLTLVHELLGLKEKMMDLHQRVHAVEEGQDEISHALDHERVQRRNASVHAQSPVLEAALEQLHRSVEHAQRSMDGPAHISSVVTGMSGSATGLDGSPRSGGFFGARTPRHATIAVLSNADAAGAGAGRAERMGGEAAGAAGRFTPPPPPHGGGGGAGGSGGSPNGSSALMMPSTVASGYPAEQNTPFHSGNSLRQKLSEGATRHSTSSIAEYHHKGDGTVDDSYVSLTAGRKQASNGSGGAAHYSGATARSHSQHPNATATRTTSSSTLVEKEGGGSGAGGAARQSTTTNTTAKEETYAPPPTSDSESDRDNHHLTRLALD